jgi:hypothetical protein
MTANTSLLDKIQNVDKRVLYWVLFIGLMIPLLFPVGFPVAISPTTQSLYNKIQTLQPGDKVILNLGSETSAWGDCLPGMVATTKAILQRQAKLVVVGPLVDTKLTWAKIKDSVPAFKTLTDGTDYVFLDQYTGQQAGVARIASSVRSVFPTDYTGIPLDQIPLMTGVDSAKDFKMVISSDSGESIEYWIREWNIAFGIPVAEIGITQLGSSMMPFYSSGNLFGMSIGIRGAAEMERLIGQPADATMKMDSISLSHTLVIAAVLLANVGYFASKGKGGS